jgi:hypothetical protein
MEFYAPQVAYLHTVLKKGHSPEKVDELWVWDVSLGPN